ncbi:MAG TPA: hypothetical protein VJZ71_09655 [Phycisphaerae bacterium]|nr:hypothetical protein [Phycisphaerae bacterium]
MTTMEKLTSLTERKAQVRRELDDIRAARPESENTALADLEAALNAELDRIDGQIDQIKTYLSHVPAESA